MVRRKVYTLINIFGLAIGLTSRLLIGLYISEELSYDEHHEKASRIFRVTDNDFETGKHWAPIGPPVGKALAEKFPQIEEVVMFIPALEGVVLSNGMTEHKENGLIYSDPSVFKVFTLPILKGNTRTALDDLNSIVIKKNWLQNILALRMQ